MTQPIYTESAATALEAVNILFTKINDICPVYFEAFIRLEADFPGKDYGKLAYRLPRRLKVTGEFSTDFANAKKALLAMKDCLTESYSTSTTILASQHFKELKENANKNKLEHWNAFERFVPDHLRQLETTNTFLGIVDEFLSMLEDGSLPPRMERKSPFADNNRLPSPAHVLAGKIIKHAQFAMKTASEVERSFPLQFPRPMPSPSASQIQEIADGSLKQSPELLQLCRKSLDESLERVEAFIYSYELRAIRDMVANTKAMKKLTALGEKLQKQITNEIENNDLLQAEIAAITEQNNLNADTLA